MVWVTTENILCQTGIGYLKSSSIFLSYDWSKSYGDITGRFCLVVELHQGRSDTNWAIPSSFRGKGYRALCINYNWRALLLI